MTHAMSTAAASLLAARVSIRAGRRVASSAAPVAAALPTARGRHHHDHRATTTTSTTTTRRSLVVVRAAADAEFKGVMSRALRTIDGATGSSRTASTTSSATAPAATPTPAATPAATADDDGDGEIEYTLMGPEPKKFGVADGELMNVLTASVPFATRLVSGALCEGWTPSIVEGPIPEGTYSFGEFGGRHLRETSDVEKFPRPAKPLRLYEFEGCPFCRKVREAVIWLDLDVEFYPTPQGGPTFREFVKSTGGKSMFPYLVDPNTETSMYESDDIVDYLYDAYGPGKDKVPSLLRAGALTILTAGFGLAPRMGAGSKYKPAKMPEKPITVYSYEASPFCKLVREKLVELELPHLLKASGRGSPKRQELMDKRGRFQAPYMEDPNTGVAMFESAAIVEYLEKTYAA